MRLVMHVLNLRTFPPPPRASHSPLSFKPLGSPSSPVLAATPEAAASFATVEDAMAAVHAHATRDAN